MACFGRTDLATFSQARQLLHACGQNSLVSPSKGQIGLAAYSFDFKGFCCVGSDFGGNVNAGEVLRDAQGKFKKRAYLLVDSYVSIRRGFATAPQRISNFGIFTYLFKPVRSFMKEFPCRYFSLYVFLKSSGFRSYFFRRL